MEYSKEQISVEKPEKHKEQKDAVVLTENQQEFFERLERTNILPAEKREWSLDELKQNLDRTFCDCGQIALAKNKGKIFLTLSGGLDSTLALAFLRKNFPENEIVTFAMGGSVNHPDVLHARLAAEKFGSNHHEFIPEPGEIQEALAEHKSKFQEDDLEKVTKTGSVDVTLLYKYLSKFHPNVLLACDGIDELMGGYWDHRKRVSEDGKTVSEDERKQLFLRYWQELVPHHLSPLIKIGDNFGIGFLFPYLDQKIIESVSGIPLKDRTSKEVSKKPLREIAQELGVPKEIIDRPKRGQVGMLDIK